MGGDPQLLSPLEREGQGEGEFGVGPCIILRHGPAPRHPLRKVFESTMYSSSNPSDASMTSKCEPLSANRCVPVSTGSYTVRKKLKKRIAHVLSKQMVKQPDNLLDAFTRHVIEAASFRRYWKSALRDPDKHPSTDILKWITCADDLDEVLWRVFLAGHFGRPSGHSSLEAESAGRLLCGFGPAPVWTWRRVSSDPLGFQAWLRERQSELLTLKFGNHRKYESQEADALFKVVDSFVKWVKHNGGSPRRAFETKSMNSAEEKFDALFRTLKIWRFGRTAKFDTLCLLGDLGIFTIRPGSCYLRDSTGPLSGARKLFGRQSVAKLSIMADQIAKALQLPMEVFEDALCNWQKE